MEVREKILIQAHELFAKEGIRSVTMDDLAQSLGMSKRTIYEHFKDKCELVKEDGKYFSLELKKGIECILVEADNIIQGIASMLHYINNVIMKVTPTYFTDMKKFYPLAYENLIGDPRVRDFSVTNEFVQKGVEQGIFKSDINVKLVSFFINKSFFREHDEVFEIEGVKLGDFEKDVMFAYFLGISTEKGKVLIEEEQAKYIERITTMRSLSPYNY